MGFDHARFTHYRITKTDRITMPEFTDTDMRDTNQEPQGTEKPTLPDPDDLEFPEIRNAGTRRLNPSAARKMLEGVADRVEDTHFKDGTLSIPGRKGYAHLWIADRDGEALVRAQTTKPTISTEDADADVLVPVSQLRGGGFFARSVATAVRDTVKLMRR